MNADRIAVRAPGTCGELAQGFFQGEYAIVTAPIDRHATAVAHPAPAADHSEPKRCWQVHNSSYAKVTAALRLAGQQQMLTGGGLIDMHSALPRGKGFGSSTADIAAAVAAAGLGSGRVLAPGELAQVCAAVEPSDGTMYPGACLFASRSGRLLQQLPAPPPMVAGILDWGGRVDTQRFHQLAAASDESANAEAFQAVISGLVRRQPWDIGWGATQSALTHQKTLHKPGLERLAEWVKDAGGYGVCVAHTGTIAGVLFAPGADWDEIRRWCRRTVPQAKWWGVATLATGGLTWLPVAVGDAERLPQAEGEWQTWPSR